MAEDGKQDWIYGTVLVLVLLLVGISLILDYGRGVDLGYVNFFIVLIGFGVVAALVLGVISMGLDGDGYKPNIIDSSSVRGLADRPWSRTIAAGILFLIFIGGGLFTQSSIIPIVNPYDASTLIAKGSTLSTDHSQFATALRAGVYPGFGEDVAGFVFTSITTFGLLLLFKRFDEDALNDGLLFGISAFLSCVLWGFVFASAHALAYGSNAPAFIFAWLYGSVTQFVNQLVGAPVSILAHIGHNFVIVASLSIAACVGTFCAGFLFLPRGLLMKPMTHSRKGFAGLIWIIGLVVIVVIAIAAAVWHYSGDAAAAPTGNSVVLADVQLNVLCKYNAVPPPYDRAPYYIRCENPPGLSAQYGLAYKRDGFCTDTTGLTPTKSLQSCMQDFVSETKCKDVTPTWDIRHEQESANLDHLYHKFNCSAMTDEELRTLLGSRTNG